MYRMESKICPVCGKIFYPAAMHLYKRRWRKKTYTLCGYSCYIEFEKDVEKTKRHGRDDVNKSLDKDVFDVL